MVEETRKIILNWEEVVQALESFRRVTTGFLPMGKVRSCVISTDTAVKVGMEAAHGQSPQNMEVSLDQDALLEPTIQFCIENNIKLPRVGKKSIKIENGSVVLCIYIGNPLQELLNLSPSA